MDEITLTIPAPIRDALPADDDAAIADMERAVRGWERQVNAFIEADESTGRVVDMIERFEQRWEQYDAFVVELRSWGRSPIYAMSWRDLHAAMIQQLYDHAELGQSIDRERNARIVDDGIRKNQ